MAQTKKGLCHCVNNVTESALCSGHAERLCTLRTNPGAQAVPSIEQAGPDATNSLDAGTEMRVARGASGSATITRFAFVSTSSACMKPYETTTHRRSRHCGVGCALMVTAIEGDDMKTETDRPLSTKAQDRATKHSPSETRPRSDSAARRCGIQNHAPGDALNNCDTATE